MRTSLLVRPARKRLTRVAGLALLSLTAGGCAVVSGAAAEPLAAVPQQVAAAPALAQNVAQNVAQTSVQPGAQPAAAPLAFRPNLMMVTVDDASLLNLRWMPQLRRAVTNDGVRFTNAVAPTPLCVPARASLLTGQYAHNHGAHSISGFKGGVDAMDDRNTLPVWLRGAGYDTMFVGKYLNGYGTTAASPVTDRPPGWSSWNALTPQGTYRMNRPVINHNGRIASYRGYSSDVLTDLTSRMLSNKARKAKPWYLWLNYVAPHYAAPAQADDPTVHRRWKGTPGAKVATPSPDTRDQNTFAKLNVPKTPNLWYTNPDHPLASAAKPLPYRTAVRELFQQRVESLRSIDRGIGRLVATLRKTGQLGRTVLVFTSDNGFSEGQNNHVGKIFPWRDSLSIPVVARGPGLRPGSVVTTPVGNPDWATTFAALGRATPRLPQDGVNIYDHLGGQDRVLPIQAWPVGGGTRAIYRGIRTQDFTYARFTNGTGGDESLYDLRRDPYERHNLARDPAAAGLLEQARALEERHHACAGDGCSAPLPPGERALTR